MITYVGIARNMPEHGTSLMITSGDWHKVHAWLFEQIEEAVDATGATHEDLAALGRVSADLSHFVAYKGEEWCAPDRPGSLPGEVDFMLNIVDSEEDDA